METNFKNQSPGITPLQPEIHTVSSVAREDIEAGEPLSPTTAGPLADQPRPERHSGMLLLRDLVLSLAASVLIVTFLYQPVRVEGISMLPRLEDSDRLFINKFVYRFSAIERGDVVVFHYPRNPEQSFIKRIIALPGDRIRIEHGTVIVNGKPIDEPYVPEEFRDWRSMPEETVPVGQFFVLGDHRNIALDSREFGPVERSLIYGKAVFVYWPAKDVGVVR